jgi:hypothetical protein
MGPETIGSTEEEQDWIQKYRTALEARSRTESRRKAVCATFSKVAGILSFGMRSILKKRASTSPNAVVSKQLTKAGLVPTPTILDRQRLDTVSEPARNPATTTDMLDPLHSIEGRMTGDISRPALGGQAGGDAAAHLQIPSPCIPSSANS